MSIHIPLSLLETIQSAFTGEAKRLCRDAAKILKVSEKELLHKILPNGSKIKLVDDNSAPITCPAIIKEGILTRCRSPCILGTGRCLHHQTAVIPITDSLTPLTRLEGMSMWCNEETGDVYESTGTIIGKYKDNTIKVFVLED